MFKGFNKREQTAYLSRINCDYLIFDAVFSDETDNFVNPCEPLKGDDVKVSIRVFKNNVDNVFVVSNDKKYSMTKKYDTSNFSYYETTILNIQETFSYYFLIEKNNVDYIYNKFGLSYSAEEHYNFNIIPDFTTPDWAKSTVMYQIYVDRFYNGCHENDVKTNEYKYLGKPVQQKEWTDDITNDDVWNFYGGDLQGVIEKADYLQDLGVECIYFNPVFVSPSNHKYDISDYDYVDPHIAVIIEDGDSVLEFENFHNDHAKMYIKRTTSKVNLEASNELLIKLIDIFHSKGIKVILDGVFNHCGAFNKWLDTEGFYKDGDYPLGAYQDENSIYHNYFNWLGDQWDKDNYDGWWGYKNHPKLNFESSKELEDYILTVAKKWVSPPFNADGWRLDVAADLGLSEEYNHIFWEKFRKAVKDANKDAIIIAEHYGNPKPWLLGNNWDTIMNYDAFMEPITWFLTGMEKHSESYKQEYFCNSFEFVNRMKYFMAFFTIQSLNTSMNQLSNHDHSRFLSRTNHYVGRLHTDDKAKADENVQIYTMYIAITMQMTWVGSPTLYYGDEAGLCGFTDPDNRRPYPWGNENMDLLNYYKLAISVHKQYPALKHGSIELLYSEYGIICYGRFTNSCKMLIIVNNTMQNRTITIPIWRIGTSFNSKMKVVLRSKKDSYNTFGSLYNIVNGQLDILVNRVSSIILIEE